MIEKTFENRVPTYPNRVTLTPVAGQTNTYDMVRADEPVKEGTPIDKATFDSIIHSRLTGRYYVPTVVRSVIAGRTGLTVSPIPTAGWVYDTEDANKATNGLYAVEVSSNNGASWQAAEAFDGSGWQSMGGAESWIVIYHAQAMKVRQMRFRVAAQYSARLSALVIEGSTNGSSWSQLHRVTSITTGSDVTYTLTSTGDYNYYRLRIESSDSNRVTVSNLSYALYDISTYTNAYKVSAGLPTSWSDGQRLALFAPASVNTFAVDQNTLNGVDIRTVLQPSKYYELIYISSVSAFIAREM